MKFVTNLDKNNYNKFLKDNPDLSHFLQTYEWGEFNEKLGNLKPYYIGVYEEDKLTAVMLLLKKSLPLGMSYFYAPRGPIINFNNQETVKFLFENLHTFARENNAIFIKFDPRVIIYQEDTNANVIKERDLSIYDNLMKMPSIKHLGFTKNFETSQPRYTYQIDLNKSEDELFKKFGKSTKSIIRRAEKFNNKIVIKKADGIKEFYELFIKTEKRKNFIGHNLKYYKLLADTFGDYKIYFEYLNIKGAIDYYEKLADELREKISKLSDKKEKQKKELDIQLKSQEKKVNIYREEQNKYGDELLLNAHFIIYEGDKAWSLYAANEDILQDAGTNFELYKKHILDAKAKGYKIYDHFGCVDKNSDNKELLGLNELKKTFGGDYTEFIGEFDLVTNKLFYFLFTKLVPIYRKFINWKLKRKLNN